MMMRWTRLWGNWYGTALEIVQKGLDGHQSNVVPCIMRDTTEESTLRTLTTVLFLSNPLLAL